MLLRALSALFGSTLLLGLLPAHAQEAADASKPELTAVYIGASWLPDATRMFIEDLEADLNAEVFFTQRNQTLVALATRSLQSGQWEILRDADIVVVNITEATDDPGYCVSTPSDTPYRTTPEQFRIDVEAFLAELTARTNPDTTLIRVTTHAALPHFRSLWHERGVETECLAGLMALNAQWVAAAADHGIPVVDPFTAWNGADGTRNAPREYFGEDAGHLSPLGARAAADLLKAAGYAPLDK